MKLFDYYLIKQFLLTAAFAMAAIVIIFVIIDCMENLDDFIDGGADVLLVMEYYMYFMPEIIKLMIPVAMLLSALFTTGRLSALNELTAMKASGLSLYRFMAPILIISFLISLGAVYFNGWVVPYTNKQKFTLARVYLHKYLSYLSKANIFIQDSETRMLSIGYFDDERETASKVSVEEFSDTNLTVMKTRCEASQMVWNSDSRTWTLMNGTKRTFNGDKETLEHFTIMEIGRLNFTPDDVKKKHQKPDEMNYYELKEFIQNQKRSGHDVSRWQVDFYSKISFPFASFIVVLFGVPFSSIKRRSGVGVEFGIAVGISFLYMILLKISQAFGYNGDLNPLLTAWLANITFLFAGIYVMLKVPK
ncbi:MAG: LPS export ABC transporter permease LptG [Bacteroidota bacterium]|nr:LPS export ABC transporter permease LptG [Bacteroidota bacterium]